MRRAIIAIFLSLTVRSLCAADPQEECRKPEKILGCSAFDVAGAFMPTSVDPREVEVARIVLRLPKIPLAPTSPAATTDLKADTKQGEQARSNLVENEVRTENVALTPPPSSDARIHASHHNFNIPLSMAINSVTRSKDEQSLIVAFNKANAGPFSFGTKATITQPVLFSNIQKSIEEKSRATVADNLTGMLEDTDNIAISIELSPRTPVCTDEDLTSGSCYGREVGKYRRVLSQVLLGLVKDIHAVSSTTNAIEVGFQNWLKSLPNGPDTFVKDLDPEQRGILFDFITATRLHDAMDTEHEIAEVKKIQIPNLALLIENQPQWTLTATSERRDPLVGQNKFALDLEYERGLTNLNTVVSGCKTESAKCVAEALQQPKRLKSNTFTFGVSVKQADSYKFEQLPKGSSEVPVVFGGVILPRVRTYLGSAQYGFDVEGATINNKPTHLDFAGSWSQTTGDPKKKHTRLVISSTLTIPLGEAVSLPVTVSYANHEEFLKDTQKGLGLHFGLTYRLPFKKPS